MRAATGKLSAEGTPLVRLERAAMIYFGVPSFGVHLNGYVEATGKICVQFVPLPVFLVAALLGPTSRGVLRNGISKTSKRYGKGFPRYRVASTVRDIDFSVFAW